MVSTLVLLLQLLLVSLASASHHFGGTVTFSYKGRNPDGSFKVDVRNRATYDGCQYSHYWYCHSGNCGYDVKNQRGILDRSTNAPQYNNQWCETETVLTKRITNDKPFQMRVPQNCPRTYRLMSFDPDGDKVRCRYGNVVNIECSRCDQPSGFHLDQDSCTLHYHYAYANPSVYGFELVVEDFPQRPITLAYTDGSRSSRSPLAARRGQATTSPSSITPNWWWWGQHSTTTPPPYPSTTGLPYANTVPLSKLPLQFSLLVDPVAPSCQEGEYLPRFVNPTPQNGERIHAEVNKEVEIRVKAQARYSTIHDIIISGPMNISKHRTTHDEFVIRWTPIPEDLGDHYPICFAVESFTGSAVTATQSPVTGHHHHHPTPTSQSGIYQSDMRCVLVDVKKEEVKTNVICSESTMTVEVEKSSLSGFHEDRLQLSDPTNIACSLQHHSNSTHVIAVIPLNACGTQLEEDEDYLIFKNEITTVDNHRDLITRKHLLEVEFYCQYPKRGNVTLGFTAHRKNVTVWEKGFGTFTYQFEFYQTNQFQTMKDPNSYPLEYDVGSRIYMEIEASSSVNNTELFVESCWAAPYDNPNYWPTYPIIENGCNVDETVKTHSADNQRQFRFCMEAFKFIGMHDQVYISCSVLMCEAGNPNTRCSRGCINSTRSGSHHHHHRKREAVIQSASHFVSQGPLRLRRSAESTENTVTHPNLNLNLVFIAGCLLAAVGMISAVVMYKTKMSKVKYQPLPVFES
ncbi:uncharacterized protein LOC122986506 [Thunnus albacares]|uniref:uncharacterized protein LOC122986506 n=1 Tax=Thunnus albacares TaxID=8236 RepID=UPI001CF6F376|nr:uncharacterized protein LOC122986506 [Thunnus albacares]